MFKFLALATDSGGIVGEFRRVDVVLGIRMWCSPLTDGSTACLSNMSMAASAYPCESLCLTSSSLVHIPDIAVYLAFGQFT